MKATFKLALIFLWIVSINFLAGQTSEVTKHLQIITPPLKGTAELASTK